MSSAQERRELIRSTWSRDEMDSWDEQRRAYQQRRAPQATPNDEVIATADPVVPQSPVGTVNWREIANEVSGRGPLSISEYTEALDLLNTIVPLPPSHVRPEAGIRGGPARAHARAEAQPRSRTEFARVALARSTAVPETVEFQARLRVRERVEEILAERFGVPDPPAPPHTELNSSQEGSRVPREFPLEVAELYVGSARPANVTTEERLHQVCVVCRQVKSNPVS
ncbi:hypothetical protein C8R47DRAFT_1207231 [Mycena vitilis]|nr:hypothetical protein C8R47DRAFT_1207231 [Mycena vitilis]